MCGETKEMITFSKKAFCKTCHIKDHLQECYNHGHQINDPPKTFKRTEHDYYASFDMGDTDFEGIK